MYAGFSLFIPDTMQVLYVMQFLGISPISSPTRKQLNNGKALTASLGFLCSRVHVQIPKAAEITSVMLAFYQISSQNLAIGMFMLMGERG